MRPGSSGARSAGGRDLDRALEAANAGDLKAAASAARAAFAKDPNLEKAYLLLGSACAMMDDAACEAEAYDLGTAALPRSAALLNERGLLRLRGGDAKAAIADLEAANTISGERDAKYMADLAYAYLFVDRAADGDALARRARKLDPRSFDAASAHGEILLRMKDGAGAAEAFRAAGELTEDPEVERGVERQLGIALSISGDREGALVIFERLLGQVKDDPMLHVYAAEALMKLDRPKPASEHMAAAVELAPKDTRFLALLLETQKKAGDKKGAEATKKKLSALGVKP